MHISGFRLVVPATRLRQGSPGLASMGCRSLSEGGKQGPITAGHRLLHEPSSSVFQRNLRGVAMSYARAGVQACAWTTLEEIPGPTIFVAKIMAADCAAKPHFLPIVRIAG